MALLLALVMIFALSLVFASDSILLLLGLFVFLGLDPYVKKWLRHYKNSFAIEVLLALTLMVSMFFSIRLILHDATAQATLVAVALLCLGFTLILFPVYENDESDA